MKINNKKPNQKLIKNNKKQNQNNMKKELTPGKIFLIVILIIGMCSCRRESCPSHDSKWFYNNRM